MSRHLIFGAGAIGTLLGGLMAKAGGETVFVGRKWNVEGIRTQGVRISGLWGEHAIPPQSAYETIGEIPAQDRQFDYVFICVKAFSTSEAIADCAPILQDSTLAVSCQNGYGNCQTIAQTIGWNRTLGARVITGVELYEPGAVRVTVHADAVRLGHYRREFPLDRLQAIASRMRGAGIPIEATDQLEQYVWAKILYNAALNPMGALLGVTYGALGENEETRAIMNRIIEEAFAATTAHGIRQFWPTPAEYQQAFYEKMLPPTAAHFPSMLRDLEKGRRTEIDALNGAICTLGKEKGIPTPVNDAISALLRFREKQLQKR